MSSATLSLVVNGEPQRVETGTSLEDLVEALGLERQGLAIAVDDLVVPRSTWGGFQLGQGSRVEILTIAQGG